MQIVIAPDSFKESLSALEVCYAIQRGFQAVFPQAEYINIPLADGGEGTAHTLKDSLNGTWQTLTVHDPLMRTITAQYAISITLLSLRRHRASFRVLRCGITDTIPICHL